MVAFSYVDHSSLAKLARVSTTWRSLALSPSLWSRFNFAPYYDGIYLEASMDGGNNESSPPTPGKKWTLESLLSLPQFSSLSSLELSHWKETIDDEWITRNLSHLTNLRNLVLAGCLRVKYLEVPDLVSLTSIDFSGQSMGLNISNDSLQNVGKLAKLRKINLHYCEKVSPLQFFFRYKNTHNFMFRSTTMEYTG